MKNKTTHKTKRSPTQRYSLNYPRILSVGKRCKKVLGKDYFKEMEMNFENE